MNKGIWIGQLSKANNFFIQFKPFAQLVDGCWEKLDPKERVGRFPKNGLVRGKPDKIYNGRVETLWVFECRPSGVEADYWFAEAPERAVPLLDMSEQSLEDARVSLFEHGIKLSEGFGNQFAVLLADGTYTILRFERKGGTFFARLPADGVIELRRAAVTLKMPADMLLAFLPHKGEPSDEIVARIDWSSDADFLVRVVHRYRAALNGYLVLGHKGDVPLKRLEKSLAEGHLGPGSAAELGAILERLRSEWPETARSLQAVEGMTQLLMETDEAQEMLAAAVERQRQASTANLEREVRQEIDERFKRARDEFSRVEQDIKTSKLDLAQITASTAELLKEKELRFAEISEADARLVESETAKSAAQQETVELEQRCSQARKDLRAIDSQREEAERALERLKAALCSFIGGLRKEVEMSWANDAGEIGIFAGRIERLLAEEGMPIAPIVPSSIPPWWKTSRSDALPIHSSAMHDRLVQEAANHGVLVDDLALLDGFARAGELVLLLGDQAELHLRAYARVVAGGEIRSHALDPGVIGLDDLWRVPNNSRPTAFALAWHHARTNPQDIVLVCLRDFDAAPFRMWLASLQAVLASDERPRNLLVTAIASVAPTTLTSGETDVHALRHYLVAQQPKTSSSGSSAKVVLDESLPTSTFLLHQTCEVCHPSYPIFSLLRERGVHPNAVRRALRLFGVLGEGVSHKGQPLAASWAGYLNDGIASSLPPSIAAGYEGLEALAIQR